MVYIDQGDGSAQYGHTHKGDPSRAWSESVKGHRRSQAGQCQRTNQTTRHALNKVSVNIRNTMVVGSTNQWKWFEENLQTVFEQM